MIGNHLIVLKLVEGENLAFYLPFLCELYKWVLFRKVFPSAKEH